jgi:hypothetical protein
MRELTIERLHQPILKADVLNFTCYLKKDKDFFTTIGDLYGNFNPKDINLDSEEKIVEYAETVKKYIETDGQKFIKHYSHLPNILAEMDRLEKEGKDWNEILSGMGDRLFRGLIISKLCNDSNFKEKENYCDRKFHTVVLLNNRLPYYNKLKERLKTLEPVYNIKNN